MKQLRQITVIGLGLLGSSVTLAVLRSLSGVKSIGYSHRAVTRQKARKLGVAQLIVDDIESSVSKADIVILATPICTFEGIFSEIADFLPAGCVVTDVGSTKTLAHRWAKKRLPKTVCYVGSHPIAGSEKRGVEYARDDLFFGADCILTKDTDTKPWAVKRLRDFWSALGCNIKQMSPVEHDKVFSNVSHLPHVVASSLVNSTVNDELKFAGKGFLDTSRIASGPANIWADILVTNSSNVSRSIGRLVKELLKLQKAVKNKDAARIEKLLSQAGTKRSKMVKHKIKKGIITS